jgi:hypothetical protein
LAGSFSPILVRTRKRWLNATEHRVETIFSVVSSIKGVKMMGISNECFQTIQELRAAELAIGKYGLLT